MLLALSLTVHLLAAILWLSALFSSGFLLIPRMMREEEFDPWQESLKQRFLLIQKACFGSLLVSGIYLMTQDSHYDGWLSFSKRWSQLLLVKHIIVSIMIIMIVLVGGILEPMRRQTAVTADSALNERVIRWETWIPRFQFILSIFVVILSAALVTQ